MTKKAVFGKIASGLVKASLWFVEHPELLQIIAQVTSKGK